MTRQSRFLAACVLAILFPHVLTVLVTTYAYSAAGLAAPAHAASVKLQTGINSHECGFLETHATVKAMAGDFAAEQAYVVKMKALGCFASEVATQSAPVPASAPVR